MPTRINDRYQLPDIGDDQLDSERQVVEILQRAALVNHAFSSEEWEIIAKWCGEFLRYARSRRVDDDIAIALHPPPICSKIDLEPGVITCTLGDALEAPSDDHLKHLRAYAEMEQRLRDRPKPLPPPEEPGETKPAPTELLLVGHCPNPERCFICGPPMRPNSVARGKRECGCGAPEPHTPGGIHCRRK